MSAIDNPYGLKPLVAAASSYPSQEKVNALSEQRIDPFSNTNSRVDRLGFDKAVGNQLLAEIDWFNVKQVLKGTDHVDSKGLTPQGQFELYEMQRSLQRQYPKHFITLELAALGMANEYFAGKFESQPDLYAGVFQKVKAEYQTALNMLDSGRSQPLAEANQDRLQQQFDMLLQNLGTDEVTFMMGEYTTSATQTPGASLRTEQSPQARMQHMIGLAQQKLVEQQVDQFLNTVPQSQQNVWSNHLQPSGLSLKEFLQEFIPKQGDVVNEAIVDQAIGRLPAIDSKKVLSSATQQDLKWVSLVPGEQYTIGNNALGSALANSFYLMMKSGGDSFYIRLEGQDGYEITGRPDVAGKQAYTFRIDFSGGYEVEYFDPDGERLQSVEQTAINGVSLMPKLSFGHQRNVDLQNLVRPMSGQKNPAVAQISLSMGGQGFYTMPTIAYADEVAAEFEHYSTVASFVADAELMSSLTPAVRRTKAVNDAFKALLDRDFSTAENLNEVESKTETLQGNQAISVFLPADEILLSRFKRLVVLGESLVGQRYHNSDLSGANLTDAQLSRSSFSMVLLDGADLSRADLSDTHFNAPSLQQANLSGANLSGATVMYGNLSNADLTGVVLTEAVLRGVDLSGAVLRGADLTGTRLLTSGPTRYVTLFNADLRNAQLTGVEFDHVDLRYADLRGADLKQVVFGSSVSDFSHADLRGADLSDIDLRYTILTNAKVYASQLDTMQIVEEQRAELHVFENDNASDGSTSAQGDSVNLRPSINPPLPEDDSGLQARINPRGGSSVNVSFTTAPGNMLNPNGLTDPSTGTESGLNGNNGNNNRPTAVASPGGDSPFSNSIPDQVPLNWAGSLNNVSIPSSVPSWMNLPIDPDRPDVPVTPESDSGGVTIGGQLGNDKGRTAAELGLDPSGKLPGPEKTKAPDPIPGYGEGVPPADVGSNDTSWGLPDEPITLPENEGFPEKDPVLDQILNPNGVGRPQFTFPPIKEGSRIPEVPTEAQAALTKALPELQGIRYAQFSQLSAADQQQIIPRTLAYQQLAPNDKANISLIDYLDSSKTSEPQRQQLSRLDATQTADQAKLDSIAARIGLTNSTIELIDARINALQANTAQINQQTQSIQQANGQRINALATQAQTDPMGVAFIKPETPQSTPENRPQIKTPVSQNSAPIPRFMVVRTENGPKLIENLANGQSQLHAYPLSADTPITRQESNGAWSGVPDVGQIGSRLFLDLLFTNGALKMLNNGNPVQAPNSGTPQQPPVNSTPQTPTGIPQPGF